MEEKIIKKRIIKVLVISLTFLLLIIFYHHIEKYTTGFIYLILTLLIPVSFIAIIFYFIKETIQIFRNIRHLTFNLCLPMIITFLTLFYLFFSPYRLDSESLESRVVMRACFEGTQNQAYILFRENNTFEINWTGVFFANSWFYGNYTQKVDTIYLDYKTKKPYRLGDTLVNTGQNLITINKARIDSNQYFVPFYLGYCKGLN